MERKQKYDVAAYIWPSYTGDEIRSRIFWQEGYGEWQTVKNAGSKFPGHNWPRKPLWGYTNEADPYVMEMQINAAADHGVNVFIYDWYWYDDRPFLENCLNDGYLKAKNNDRVQFYLMWANHTATTLWDIRNSSSNTPIWDGAVNERQFDYICDRLINNYFKHPSYYKINGEPVFMIYEIENLVRGLGGIAEARRKLDEFTDKCVKAGLGGLHLQMTQWGERILNIHGTGHMSTADVIKNVGFKSLSNYQFVHFINIDRDYNEIMEDVLVQWDRFDKLYDVPYFPHISVGWDNNPRYKEFRPGIVKNNTPENIEKAMRHAKNYIDTHPNLPVPLVVVNSWNEWTETSYLLPDDLYGYGYLEAIKKVFM
jgi:hypothetical protein